MSRGRVDEINSANGFLVPIYWEYGPDGNPRYGLGPEDFRKVQQGYACPACLADFGGLYRVRCPVCTLERDVERDFFEEPNYWKPDPNDPDRN